MLSPKALKHEVVNQEQQTQLTYIPQNNNKFDQIQEVSEFGYVLQEAFQQFVGYLLDSHLLSAIHKHVMHPLLVRRGSYFTKLVNGFIWASSFVVQGRVE